MIDMEALLYAGGASAAILAMVGAGKIMWRGWKRIDDFLLDWSGEPARPGHDRVPSMSERMRLVESRLSSVEQQVTPNGGNTETLGDRVVRIERTLTPPPEGN